MMHLPIPDASATDRDAISDLALAITAHAQTRYALHRQAHHRLLTDLGAPDQKLNQKLTAWWELDFPGLRRELQTAFKHDIPLKQRAEWEAWLGEQRAGHERLTAEIVRLEGALNAGVYELFDLDRAEIEVIEAATKYRYGEV